VLAFDADIIEAAKACRITKGTQVYCEGRLQIGQWCGDDGRSRIELKMMARFCRLPEIGRNRPKRAKPVKKVAAPGNTTSAEPLPPFNDEIGF
jgi:single-stranded DNA-binding protein